MSRSRYGGGRWSRWGLRVKPVHGDWYLTACRFDPDTEEAARQCGEKGVADGRFITAFEVVDRRQMRIDARRRQV